MFIKDQTKLEDLDCRLAGLRPLGWRGRRGLAGLTGLQFIVAHGGLRAVTEAVRRPNSQPSQLWQGVAAHTQTVGGSLPGPGGQFGVGHHSEVIDVPADGHLLQLLLVWPGFLTAESDRPDH